jgi:uncharacterized protein
VNASIGVRKANRLAGEQSPYLRQHQHNPVDWYPWGEEAFAKAREENKLVFLSIGYATCHWCHVMERESFENARVAAVLNEHFVAIKVDREERPDLDHIYMSAVQAMVGQGGWPLTVFLTPDRQPFYGGTYYPPEPKHDRPGLIQVLHAVQRLWNNQVDKVLTSARDLTRQLQLLNSPQQDSTAELRLDMLVNALHRLKTGFDSRHGGFGGPPKFPHPSQQRLLLRLGTRLGDQEAIQQVLFTCDRMAAGGIHDHLGGGFARYSVDAEWQVPHFEKMLYDNAQLAQLYLDAYVIGGSESHAEVVRDILGYVARDLTHPLGGFYSAEDADSEGKEGKYYCWTLAELKSLLEDEELEVVTRFYGVTAQGNFVDHSDPDPLPGQNVLHLADASLDPAQLALLDSARAKLLAARSQRMRPLLDDKVLSSWNGLMLGAFARAGIVLGRADYLNTAEKALAFIKHSMWDDSANVLYHRWRAGHHDQIQLLSAYSFLAQGVLDLYEATLNAEYLQFARKLVSAMIDRFYDSAAGGFWQSAPATETLIVQAKEDHDSAEPSGTSVAVSALLRLGVITGELDFRTKAERTLMLYANRIAHYPEALTVMLQALDFALGEPDHLVVSGPVESEKTVSLLHAAHRIYRPNLVIMGTRAPVHDLAQQLPGQSTRPGAYLCAGQTCLMPAFTPEELRARLSA